MPLCFFHQCTLDTRATHVTPVEHISLAHLTHTKHLDGSLRLLPLHAHKGATCTWVQLKCAVLTTRGCGCPGRPLSAESRAPPAPTDEELDDLFEGVSKHAQPQATQQRGLELDGDADADTDEDSTCVAAEEQDQAEMASCKGLLLLRAGEGWACLGAFPVIGVWG